MNKEKTTKSTNIYAKLQLIQNEVGELIRTEENKGQRYWFFNELQVLKLLKPLLDKYKLTILLSDDETKGFNYEKPGNMYLVQYWKKIEIFNTESPEEKLIYYFAAVGQNTDPAKAKGSAETYAVKYFLSKLFLIPVKDEEDPDYYPKETSTSSLRSTINQNQIEELRQLFIEKRGNDISKQNNFFTEIDKILVRAGISGNTNSGNFRSRLANLTESDYQGLMEWLRKLN